MRGKVGDSLKRVFCAMALLVAMADQSVADETVPLDRIPRVYAIEPSHAEPGRLYLATDQSLFLAWTYGLAKRVSENVNQLTSFTAHPTTPTLFYASGRRPSGDNLGIIRSEDGGKTWSNLSEGVDGPVAFHAMDVSKADPQVLYGANDGIQISRDGGETWNLQGPVPAPTHALAASAIDPDTVYLATHDGLKRSQDGGKTWKPAHILKRPASMVSVTADGTVYAFIPGTGLLSTKEPSLAWKPVSNDFGKYVLLKLVVSPEEANRLYAVANTGGIVTSPDGGKTWMGYEGSDKATDERIARGEALYVEYCQSCHGVNGAGEHMENIPEGMNPAPALDDTAHAWHHSDHGLVGSILEGFEDRGGRMPGWKDTLSREDAEDIVAYFKSLWSFNSFACQGARHMACGAHGQRN